MAQEQTNSGNNIKILSVVWFKVLPAKYGGQKGTALFNEHLSKNAELVCLCSKNNEVVVASYKIINTLPVSKLQFINPFCWRKIYSLAKKENITHLILEYPYHYFAAMLVKKLLKTKVIVHAHNIEFIRFKQQKKWWSSLLYHFEKRAMKLADLVMVKTNADKNIAIKNFALPSSKITVVPYGIENKKSIDRATAHNIICRRHNIDANSKILLFAGTLDYEPNAKAVEIIYSLIVPELIGRNLNFTFIICGRNKKDAFNYMINYKSNFVISAGEVDDIENYFAAADVFVDPVLTGGGIQTKIIDALSFNLNVVCFKNKAIISETKNKLFVAKENNWNEFIDLIEKASVSHSDTPTAFFEKYNWDNIAREALNAIKNC